MMSEDTVQHDGDVDRLLGEALEVLIGLGLVDRVDEDTMSFDLDVNKRFVSECFKRYRKLLARAKRLGEFVKDIESDPDICLSEALLTCLLANACRVIEEQNLNLNDIWVSKGECYFNEEFANTFVNTYILLLKRFGLYNWAIDRMKNVFRR